MTTARGVWQRIWPALQLVVAVAATWYFIRHVEWHTFSALARNMRLVWIVIVMMVVAVRVVCSALRWRLFVMQVVPLSALVQLYLIGFFFNAFLPTNVGGDIIKGALLKRHAAVTTLTGLMSSAADRFAGIIGLVLVALGAACVSPMLVRARGVQVVLLTLICACAAVSYLMLHPHIGARCLQHTVVRRWPWLHHGLTHVISAAEQYRAAPRMLWRAVGWSLVIQIADVTIIYGLACACNLDIPYHIIALVSPLAAATGLIPVSINGLGILENTSVWLYAEAGVTHETAALLALVSRLMMTGLALIGAVAYLHEYFFNPWREEHRHAHAA